MKSKISVIAVVALCFSLYANAQTIEKGSKIITGTLNFGNSFGKSLINESVNYKTKSGTISLLFGKAFKDNLFAGFSLGYGRSRQTSKSPDVNPSESNGAFYNANLFFRAYKNIGKDFHLFVQPSLGFAFSENKFVQDPINRYAKSSGPYIIVGPGISYKILNALYIDLSLPNVLELNYTKTKAPDSESKSFDFRSSLTSQTLQSLSAGFSFIF